MTEPEEDISYEDLMEWVSGLQDELEDYEWRVNAITKVLEATPIGDDAEREEPLKLIQEILDAE